MMSSYVNISRETKRFDYVHGQLSMVRKYNNKFDICFTEIFNLKDAREKNKITNLPRSLLN